MIKVPEKNLCELVVEICEKHWEEHKSNCSGLVKAVAGELGIRLVGQANDIMDQLQSPPWRPLSNGIEANKRASDGKFVIGGRKDSPNGHVVIVVDAKGRELNRGEHPFAYWGQLHGVGRKNDTVNWAFPKEDLSSVTYYFCDK
ncbi:MAG: hypothetical protein HYY92_02075 [Parcubacteria group bacterium]|nr:hypothetical protein [Parcubacteria group bacterium]